MTITEEMTETMVDDKLAQFEQRISAQMGSMTTSVSELASSVRMLADRDIRMQERESHQQAFNTRIGSTMDAIASELKTIQLARAEERHAVEAIKRAYPWLVVGTLIGPIAVTIFLQGFFKAAPAAEQRAVVPLVQQYDPPAPRGKNQQ